MKIGGFQKTSLIDYPDKISAIVFTQGCNFRCGYCHNPELIKPEGSLIEESSILSLLESRIGKLDGVVITGGEPTLQKDLIDFIKKIKTMNYLVKLDTNGTSSEIVKNLVEENLLDYIAMDIKAPLEKYENITNNKTNTFFIQKSIDLIINSGIDYEFRTTIVNNQLNFDDFTKISELIKGAKRYYLQKFEATKTLDISFLEKTSIQENELFRIKQMLETKIKEVYIR